MHPPSAEWYLDPTVPVPLRHRIMWSPITAFMCLAGMVAADIVLGFTLARVAGLAVGVLWMALAVHNRRTRGAFVRGIWTPDTEADMPHARVVEPRTPD